MARHDGFSCEEVDEALAKAQEQGRAAREALRAVADAFEGSVLLHDMNEDEREALEAAFCLARGIQRVLSGEKEGAP